MYSHSSSGRLCCMHYKGNHQGNRRGLSASHPALLRLDSRKTINSLKVCRSARDVDENRRGVRLDEKHRATTQAAASRTGTSRLDLYVYGSSLQPYAAPGGDPRETQVTDATAKLILDSAFVDGKLEAPRSLLPDVHRLYFEPEYSKFAARTMWSLSNAFTSTFKKLDPLPQFKATGELGAFFRPNAELACDLRSILRGGGDHGFLFTSPFADDRTDKEVLEFLRILCL